MKFYVRSILGLGLFFFAWAAFEYSIYQFLQVGTCSSSGFNRYGPTAVCPSGIGVYFAGVFGGVILGLIGIGIYATRGTPPDADGYYQGPRVPFGITAWSFLFTGTALVGLYAVLGPDQHPGSGAKLAAIIIAIVFIPMGVLPLLFSLRSRSGGGGSSITSAASTFTAPTPAPSGLGTLSNQSSWGPQAASPNVTVPQATPVVPTGVRTHQPGGNVTTGTGTGASGSGNDGAGIEQLEKLKKLRDSGALTEAEFQSAKAKILEDI
jgi:hypothetical protein